MRSALLLPSQNALDQLSRFPRPSQERINYLVQEFRQQISNLMSLLVALRKVDLTHAVHCGITDEPQRIGHWLERIRKVQRFDSGIERSLSRCAGKVIDQALEPDAKQSTSCSRGKIQDFLRVQKDLFHIVRHALGWLDPGTKWPNHFSVHPKALAFAAGTERNGVFGASEGFDKVIRPDSIFGIVDIANRFNAFVLVQLFDYLFPFRVRMNAAMRTNICAVTRRLK